MAKSTRRRRASPSSKTTLLDLYETMGRVEGQNTLILAEQARASASRGNMYNALEESRRDVASAAHALAAVVKRIDIIEPNVSSMIRFKLQVSIAIAFIATAVTGAINIIVLGFSHAGEIKETIRAFLR